MLIRGRGEQPLPAEVRPDEIRRHSSSRRPAVERGERAILYAAVWQAVFAVVEIAGVPEREPERKRWAWSFRVRPLVAVADLHDAPACEEVGIFPQSLWRHSHIRLSREQFEAARTAIEAQVSIATSR